MFLLVRIIYSEASREKKMEDGKEENKPDSETIGGELDSNGKHGINKKNP